MANIFHVESISEAHNIFGLSKPKHPLVSLIHHKDIQTINQEYHDIKYTLGMYYIASKDNCNGSMKYGRNSYDFQEGSMLFVKPGQVLSYSGHSSDELHDSGWTLLFHPDIIRRSELGKTIEQYSFFSYDITEALHLSEEERQTLHDLVKKIEKEYQQNIDAHTQKLIVSNIELLLAYCTRYYDRQFYTRTNLNKDILSKFEDVLKNYYSIENQLSIGIPSVNYCAKELNISPKYLSDLLKKETGKNAKNHIDEFLIQKAKNSLLSSTKSVSEIAFDLGYEYAQHFSKTFKLKTGMTPSFYRNLN